MIAELIGVPHEDRHKIFEWSNRFVGSEDPEYIVSEEEVTEAQVEMFMYAQQLADARRDDPHDDIITTLLSAEIDGDKLSLWYISANRDEEVFDDPYRFDITRDPNPHIAFGGGGPHFCLGAQLARLEIRLLFEELARRVPAPERLDAPDLLRSNFIGGIKHLPVRLTPA